MGEPLDHRPPGWIRQGRECCIQFIHNQMVVDWRPMSTAIFAIPDYWRCHRATSGRAGMSAATTGTPVSGELCLGGNPIFGSDVPGTSARMAAGSDVQDRNRSAILQTETMQIVLSWNTAALSGMAPAVKRCGRIFDTESDGDAYSRRLHGWQRRIETGHHHCWAKSLNGITR